jgi:EpsI family protein
MRRRDLILAGLGVGALGAAEALRPRKKLILLKGGTLNDALPRELGPWVSEASDLVNPEQAGRLAKALYSEMAGRTYYNGKTGEQVMMLIAYGDTQSDLLQLHRPESCYPAVGFTLEMSERSDVAIGGGVAIPGRRVIASIQERRESIVYWTRLGERLPSSGGDQRSARLRNAMEGYVADGLLARFSTYADPATAFRTLEGFVGQLLRATPRDKLPALVGTRLAQKIV